MKKIVFFLCLLSCTSEIKEPSQKNAHNLKIEFCGLKNEYHQKCGLTKVITDSTEIRDLLVLMEESNLVNFPSYRPVAFEMELTFNYDSDEDFSIIILSSTSGNTVLTDSQRSNFYSNDALFSKVSNLLCLEELKKWEGDLTQREFEEMNRNCLIE
jgi:hypothetical protein